MKKNMYLTGLAFKFSKSSFNNLEVLKNNFENKFLLDYLKIDFTGETSQGVVNKMKAGYFAPLHKLYGYYQSQGKKKEAARVKEQAKALANNINDNYWMPYFN